MEQTDIKTLMLMEVLEKEENPSQREIARTLDISLGLVNSFIKNLTAQGIIRPVKLPKRKVKYVLTPEGIAEKNDYAIRYVSHSIRLFREAKKRVEKMLRALQDDGRRRMIFYGTGELCEIACILLDGMENDDILIVDDQMAGRRICGLPVQKESVMNLATCDAVIIMQVEHTDETREKLIAKGFAEDKIFTLLS